MGVTDSKIYRAMDFIMNFFWLNTLWLIMCLPVVTIFPATAALFGVVREWRAKSDTPFTSTFFKLFKENFRQSFFLGCFWLSFALLLVVDFLFTNQLDSPLKYPLFAFFFLLAIIYAFTTIYIFPVVVHYRVTFKTAIQNALFLSFGHLPYTLLGLVIYGTAIFLCFKIPALLFVIFSLSAYLVYSLAARTFNKAKTAHAQVS